MTLTRLIATIRAACLMAERDPDPQRAMIELCATLVRLARQAAEHEAPRKAERLWTK